MRYESYQYNSPFMGMGNNPILFIDPLGGSVGGTWVEAAQADYMANQIDASDDIVADFNYLQYGNYGPAGGGGYTTSHMDKYDYEVTTGAENAINNVTQGLMMMEALRQWVARDDYEPRYTTLSNEPIFPTQSGGDSYVDAGKAGGGVPFGGIMFYTERGELLYPSGLGNENIIYTISNSNISEFQQSLKTLNIKSSPLTEEQAQLLANVYSNNSYNVMAGYGYDGSKYTYGYINAPWYMYVAAAATIAGEGFAAGYNKGRFYSNEGLRNHYGSLPSGTAEMWSNYFSLKTFEPWW